MGHMQRTISIIGAVGAVAIAAPVAIGDQSLGLGDAQKIAKHVARLEARNHFGIRRRIGEAFKVTQGPWCERKYGVDTTKTVTCHYEVHGVDEDGDHKVVVCGIRVKVRLRANDRKTWKRSVDVCANGGFAP